jgi:hypothetical protein
MGAIANGLVDGQTLPVAIEAAVQRWLRWKTDTYIRMQSGIPEGLPYLVGLVGDREIALEQAGASA